MSNIGKGGSNGGAAIAKACEENRNSMSSVDILEARKVLIGIKPLTRECFRCC